MFFTILMPHASFRECVESYSDFTLYLTLQAMLKYHTCLSRDQHNQGWRERNIWALWAEWKQAYIRLAMMCIEKAKLRDIPYDRAAATQLFREKRKKHWMKPLWAGWERLHLEHRAALLQVGAVEQMGHRIIKLKHLENKTKAEQYTYITYWFETNHFSGVMEHDNNYNNEINDYLSDRGAPDTDIPNHYCQFNWDLRPNGSLTAWPPEPGESWLCKA